MIAKYNCSAEEEPQVYFFQEYLENPSAKNFVAKYQTHSSIIPAEWIASQATSPKGIIHRHLLGPFVAEGYV